MPAYTPSYTPQSGFEDMLSTDPSFTEEEIPFPDPQWAYQPAMPLPSAPTPRLGARETTNIEAKPASFTAPQKSKDLIRDW
jgi:hypothetical protein